MRHTKKAKPIGLNAILAVIVVGVAFGGVTIPAYLESGIRARMAVVNSRLETYAMALEAYRLDHLDYPPWYMIWDGQWTALPFFLLTTPVCYVSTDEEFHDPLGFWPENAFVDEQGYTHERYTFPPTWYRTKGYGGFCWSTSNCITNRACFDVRGEEMRDAGIPVPDAAYYALWANGATPVRLTTFETMQQYDPSNGTFSQGLMWCFGP